MKYCKLQDLCKSIIDCPHSTPEWKDTGIRIVRNFNLKDGNLDFTDGYFVDEETYYNRIKRAAPEPDDIIISREAPMGVVAIVPKNLKCCLGQRLVLLKVDKRKINPVYLLYVLMSDFVQTQFRRANATGSIVSNLCIPDLKNIIIPVIEKNQDEVSRLLASINEKLLLNRKINDNLQQIAKTIYDYWFTQFEFPNDNGKPYRSSGGQIVWNEQLKREKPIGCSVASIVKNPLSSVIKPGVDKFEQKEYLATAEVNGTSISKGTIIEYATRESRANMQPTVNSVWFAKMKNSVKHLFLNAEMRPFIENTILSTGFCGIQCTEESFEFIASFIESTYFETIKDILSHGATQKAVNNEDMESIRFIVPFDDVLKKYHEVTRGLYAQISKNICENRDLVALRTWLLPLLMNGQATVEG